MQQLYRPDQILDWSRKVRYSGNKIAFVPTMGALHAGHISLVELARRNGDRVVVSIFVNPTQFGPSEDFKLYPRDMEGDLRQLSAALVDAVYLPETGDIYPEGCTTWVVEEELSGRLEGALRPGHFRGVTTVVTKLLLQVEPDFLVLGQKDAQQAAILKRLIQDFIFPVKVIVGPIVREDSGLALSSRNSYLSEDELRQASCLYDSLILARSLVNGGEDRPGIVIGAMLERIEKEPSTRIDYVTAVDPDTFLPVNTLKGKTLFCLAVFVGDIRLIDNDIIERGD